MAYGRSEALDWAWRGMLESRLGVLVPCSRILLEKLTVPQLVKKFPHFMNCKVHYRVHNSPPQVRFAV